MRRMLQCVFELNEIVQRRPITIDIYQQGEEVWFED